MTFVKCMIAFGPDVWCQGMLCMKHLGLNPGQGGSSGNASRCHFYMALGRTLKANVIGAGCRLHLSVGIYVSKVP